MQIFMKKILLAGSAVAITLGLLSMVGCENEVKLEPIKDEPKKEQAGDKDSTAGTNGTKTEVTSSPAVNNPGGAGNQELFVIRVEDASGQDISSSFDSLSLTIGSEEGGESVYNFTSNSGGSAFQQMKSIIETVVVPGTWNFTLKASKSGQLLATSTQQAQVGSWGNTIVFKMNYDVASDTSQSGGGNAGDYNGGYEFVEFNGPSFYSSVENGWVTPVKSQGSYSTCWVYAAAAAIETAMLKRELPNANGVNLSEVFLAYYRSNVEPAPIGGMPNDKEIKAVNLHDGGLPGDLINVVCSWVGVVDQNKSYPNIQENNVSNIDNIRQEAYQKQAALVTTAGKINTCAGEDPSSLDMVSAINRMKKAISEYGSITTNYNSTLTRVSSYFNSDSKGQYCDTPKKQTHAITIVGWDDNFYSFGKIQAPKPGAWLVKNSYGEDWYDGNKGYFWLSYYDKTIGSGAVYFDVTDTSEYNNNYQYDGARTGDKTISSGPSTAIQGANIYTVKNEVETLKAVQLTMSHSKMKYKIEVYNNLKDDSDPTSGTLETTEFGDFLPEGRHTVKLTHPVSLKKDEKFSVVVTHYTDDSNTSAYLMYESAKNSNPRESFFRVGTSGAWTDMYNYMDDDGKMQCGNLRLKAFTKNLP